eukprot:6847239-Pyramimonas_sp.AAC.2
MQPLFVTPNLAPLRAEPRPSPAGHATHGRENSHTTTAHAPQPCAPSSARRDDTTPKNTPL